MERNLELSIKKMKAYAEAWNNPKEVEERIILDMVAFIVSFSKCYGGLGDCQVKLINEICGTSISLEYLNDIYNAADVSSLMNRLPKSLDYFIEMDNAIYNNHMKYHEVSERLISTYELLGMELLSYDVDWNINAEERLMSYISQMVMHVEKKRIRSNLEPVETTTNSAQKIEKQTRHKERYLVCPCCNKIVPKAFGKCSECDASFDKYDDRLIQYSEPLHEEKYYALDCNDKRDYTKVSFVSKTEGFIVTPWIMGESIKEDFFHERFRYSDGVLIASSHFSIFKDYLYNPKTVYQGTIPGTSTFDAYCCFNEYIKPMWFHANGSVITYNGIQDNSGISEEGKYIREGDLIRAEFVEKSTGKKRECIWVIANGKLCREAYANEAGLEKIRTLKSKQFVHLPQEAYNAIITKEDFFSHFPCSFCNARGCFTEKNWEFTSFGCISATGRCSKCNGFLNVIETPEDIKKIAYGNGQPNPFYRAKAGAKRYLNNSCPYCGSYEVRYTKWEDKQMSVAFWGLFSSKLHANYKCEKCGRMWE